MQPPESDEEQDERRNPIKRAEREKQFRTVGALKDIYTDPNQMLGAAVKYDKSFKCVKNTHPKDKHISIIDFSLAARGPMEDQIYAAQTFFRNNIRRGNTIVLNTATKEAEWGRKGLMKFFDISSRSIAAIIESDIKRLDKKTTLTHYALFAEIENTLSFNEDLEEKDRAKLHVYRLNKANGENAQVSYLPRTDEWVVSSKNVSILIRERADMKLYTEKRYGFAILIAEAWFTILEKKSKDEVAQVKKDLIGKTLVGEYCGNPEFQHLVKYGQITIYFYAVVENNSIYSCMLPPEAFNLLERHGIPIVKNHEKSFFGKYTGFVELGNALNALYKEVATASIFEEEEGSVIYFVMELPKMFCEYISDRYMQATVKIPEKFMERESWFHVCSLGKLKTLEYRILRKLREKLRFFGRLKNKEANEENNKDDLKKLNEKYGSFEKETYQLVKGDSLSKPLEYYFCIALLSFEYVFQNRKSPKHLEAMNDHYLDFLSIVFWCVENKKQITPNLMANQNLKLQLRQTTWENYSVEIAKDYQDLLMKIVPKFAKIRKTINLAEEAEEEEPEVE